MMDRIKKLRNALKLSNNNDLSSLPLKDRVRVAEQFYEKYREVGSEAEKGRLTSQLSLCGPDAIAECLEKGKIPAILFGRDTPDEIVRNFRALHEQLLESRRRRSERDF